MRMIDGKIHLPKPGISIQDPNSHGEYRFKGSLCTLARPNRLPWREKSAITARMLHD